MTDNALGGNSIGKVTNLVGDSAAGKTFLALTMMAETANKSRFDEYELIFDDAERAQEINIEYLFGKKTAARIKAPQYSKQGEPIHSSTIEEFFFHVLAHIRLGKPFVYVLDSFDALSSGEELAAADVLVKSEGEDTKGSFNMGKQKTSSTLFRQVVKGLSDTGSFLLIISQTRQNIGVTFGDKKRRSGGDALRFYSTHEVWLSSAKKIKKNDLIVGADVIAKVKKNKITGKVRQVAFPILYDYGVDDVTSCIQYLRAAEALDENKSGRISIPELDFTGTEKQLVAFIEENSKMGWLRKMTAKAWKAQEDALRTDRPRRYE